MAHARLTRITTTAGRALAGAFASVPLAAVGRAGQFRGLDEILNWVERGAPLTAGSDRVR